MDLAVFTRPPKIDPAVWRPEVPLVVIERCLHGSVPGDDKRLDPAKLIVTWLALRWLMAAFPKRKGYPTRLIAERVGAHMTNITAWCRRLQALGLLEKIGEEPLPRNLSRGEPLPIYTIPLLELESASQDMCLALIIRMGLGESDIAHHPQEQLALDLTAPDRLSVQASDRLSDQGEISDRLCVQASDRVSDQPDRISDQASVRIDDQVPDRLSDHWTTTTHGRRGRSIRADARGDLTPESLETEPVPDPESPPQFRAAPPTPDDACFVAHPNWWRVNDLPAHPLDLWQQACEDVRPIELTHLELFAREHDALTAGNGWYWVGHAILAASMEKVRTVTKVRVVLNRWRRDDSYGSDRPNGRKEPNDGRPAPRSSDSSGNGPDGTRLRDRSPDRVGTPQRASKRAPRPGDPDYDYG